MQVSARVLNQPLPGKAHAHSRARTGLNSSTFEIKESPVPTCNSPVFTPNSGSYVSSQNVSISSSNCPTIKYITSVTEPTDPTCSTGTTFASSFAVSTNTNVKAIACNASYNPSLITSVSYVFTPQYSVGGTVS